MNCELEYLAPLMMELFLDKHRSLLSSGVFEDMLRANIWKIGLNLFTNINDHLCTIGILKE